MNNNPVKTISTKLLKLQEKLMYLHFHKPQNGKNNINQFTNHLMSCYY